MIPPDAMMNAMTSPADENAALDNPLPPPVTGRRSEMEFPIKDAGDFETDEPAIPERTGRDPAGQDSGNQEELPEDVPEDDDFDYPVDESDDFDI